MSAYLAAVLADSPQHYWRLCDPGGSIANDIGSSPVAAYGSLNGSGAGTADGFALGYSGPNSDGGSGISRGYLWQTDGSLSAVNPQSYEGLIYFLDTTPADIYWLALANPPFAQGLFVPNGTTQVAFQPGTGTVGPSGTLTRRRWHHVVGTASTANGGRLYVDGSLVSSSHAPGTNANVRANFLASGQWFTSELAIYTTELSAARVAAHFAAIDNIVNQPVYGGAGGLGGNGVNVTDPAYLSILQQILQSVRAQYA